ncbi:MAG TPA: hypothetical protein VFR35_04305 [Actinoplanes sp.]|nr:hypothetical protein [Actinoplanes sp.]
MATATAQPPGIASVSRAVVSAAAEFVVSVERAMVGEDKVRTARSNAWDAIQADRARAQARDEMAALVRAIMANGPRAGITTRPHEPVTRGRMERPAPPWRESSRRPRA